MNAGASKLFAEGYVSGFFDMVATMLGQQVSVETGEPAECRAEDIEQLINRFNGVLQASVQSGGGVAVLLSAADVYAVYQAFMGEGAEGKEALDEADLPGLLEVYDPCLGAGVSFFKEKYGQVIALENQKVRPGGAEAAQELETLLGAPAVQVAFSFSAADGVQGEGALLFSESLEGYIPAEALPEQAAAGEAAGTDPRSQQVVNDILGSVGMSENPQGAGAQGAAAPPNIDMVLDIQLEVKARLGHVEMPINEILSLGPGSVIEVGHLVDEPIELLVNDKLIARGDVVVVDEKFGLRITEIISTRERIESLR